MSGLRRFTINVASNWVALATRTIVNLILVPFLIHKLGDTGYGVWELVGGFLAYTMLLDLGLTMAIRRSAARYAAFEDHQQQNQLMSTSIVAYSAGGLLAAGILISVAFFVPDWFARIPESLRRETTLLFIVSGALAFMRLFSTPFAAFLQGVHHFDSYNLGATLGLIVRLIVTLAVFELLPARLLWVPLTWIVGQGCETVVTMVMCYRVFPQLKLSVGQFSTAHLREVLVFGLNTLLLSLFGVFAFQAPKFIVAYFLGPVAVTFLAVGLWISTILQQGIGTMGAVFLPMFSALDAVHDKTRIAEKLWMGSQVCNLLGWILVCGTVVYAEPLITAWVGPEKLRAYWVVVILALGELGNGADNVTASALFGCGYIRGLVLSRGVAAAATCVLAVVATRDMGLGIEGAALAVAAPYLIRAIWLPWYCYRRLGIPLKPFLARGVLRPAFAAVLLGGVCGLTRWLYPVHNRFDLVISAAVLFVPSVLIAFTIGLSPEIRQRLIGAVKSRSVRVAAQP